MNVAKAKGTLAETAVNRYLRSSLFPNSERRTLSGKYDRGDINCHPDLVFEVKAVGIPSYPGLLRETETERVNAGATYGILIHKPVGVGKNYVHNWTALMTAPQFEALVQHGDSERLLHRVPRLARSLELRKAMTEANRLASSINPNAMFAVVNVRTQAGLENYFALHLRDLVLLLARAGFGNPSEEKKDQ